MSPHLQACSDGELAALTLDGRQIAFAEIMRRYREPIFRLVWGYVGDREEALDLTQECFVSAYRALGRYDRERPLKAWLSKIAINKCRDWGRRRAVRRFFSFSQPLDRAAENVAEDSPLHDQATADRQELKLVSRAIAELPTALREPLILHTIEGLSHAETAAILSITEKAVESRLYRARARLAQTVEHRRSRRPG